MDRCLNEGLALINSERRHVKSYPHPACPSSSYEVSGFRGERKLCAKFWLLCIAKEVV